MGSNSYQALMQDIALALKQESRTDGTSDATEASVVYLTGLDPNDFKNLRDVSTILVVWITEQKQIVGEINSIISNVESIINESIDLDPIASFFSQLETSLGDTLALVNTIDEELACMETWIHSLVFSQNSLPVYYKKCQAALYGEIYTPLTLLQTVTRTAHDVQNPSPELEKAYQAVLNFYPDKIKFFSTWAEYFNVYMAGTGELMDELVPQIQSLTATEGCLNTLDKTCQLVLPMATESKKFMEHLAVIAEMVQSFKNIMEEIRNMKAAPALELHPLRPSESEKLTALWKKIEAAFEKITGLDPVSREIAGICAALKRIDTGWQATMVQLEKGFSRENFGKIYPEAFPNFDLINHLAKLEAPHA